MEENINERLSELGTKILATTRNELYIHMRFLDVALSSFAYVIDPSVNGVGTDGMCIFYHPGALGGMYRQNRVRMNRAYLHMVLHCILHHVTRRKGRDKTLWNISCDIAVESIIDHWHLKCIHMVQTRLHFMTTCTGMPRAKALQINVRLPVWVLNKAYLGVTSSIRSFPL